MFDALHFPGGESGEKRRLFDLEAMPHLDTIFGVALHLTRNYDDAKDLLQETILRAWRFFHLFEPGTNCRAWLLTILNNSFRNRYRRCGRETIAVSGEDYDREVENESFRSDQSWTNPEQLLSSRMMGGLISAALRSLPSDFRTALILVDVHEMSYLEAAQTVGVAVGTIKSRVSRGRAMMRHALASVARPNGLAASRPRLRYTNRACATIARPA